MVNMLVSNVFDTEIVDKEAEVYGECVVLP